MVSQSLPAFSATPAYLAEIDASRRAPWLQSAYSASIWTVSDSRDYNKIVQINFTYRLADGRDLREAVQLHATVKEYAWWLRDARFSRIDDARTHATMVRNMMHLAHALSFRNIWSFAHLQPYDLEQLTEDCRYGADAVLHASERVDAFLGRLKTENLADEKTYGGLPRYIIPSTGAHTRIVHVEQIMSACGLPSNARVLPRVAALIAQEARANGLTVRDSGKPKLLQPLQNLTTQALQRWLDPFEHLYAMRRQLLAESIGFKPFPLGAARVAAVKGVGTQRTPSPPPALALYFLERSARWLLERPVTAESTKLDIHHDATACWILIAAFTARRDEEIDDLRDGCLRGDDESGWWLEIYIEKTLQRKEWIPVPRIVARAVERLVILSAAARQTTDTDHLFQWRDPQGGIFRMDVGRHLDSFAAMVNVPEHQPKGGAGTSWHWHPHQFRRFFALLYFYRFEGATIEALSHHLRHFNLDMTRSYIICDPEAAAIWTDVEWGYMGHIARTIASGERTVSGAAGKRLKKAARRLTEALRRKLHIISSERVGASLSTIMQRGGLVLRPKSWVICTCPHTIDAAKVAACRKHQSLQGSEMGPNFSAAGPTICASCPHAMIDANRTATIEEEIRHLSSVSLTQPRDGTIFGDLERARLVQLSDIKEIYTAPENRIGDPAADEDGAP